MYGATTTLQPAITPRVDQDESTQDNMAGPFHSPMEDGVKVMQKLRSRALMIVTVGMLLLAVAAFAMDRVAAQNDSRFFPPTGHTVSGRFLTYWDQNGGLAQQGYPLSEPIQEVSDTNGQSYMVQYFERAVFEMHPENAGPYDVLLSLLGVYEYQKRYGTTGAPNQHASTDNARFFPETNHYVGGKFRAYWESHGGLAQQGYPISDEFSERSPLDGKVYTVQYFQRAVFELHPENAGTPYEVLLSQLGTFRYHARYNPPAIPPPAAGHYQSRPQGTGGYLVWTDRLATPDNSGTANIMALDLEMGKLITVTDAPGDQINAAVSGPNVVWEEHAQSCATCPVAVAGKNLLSGGVFTVAAATGPLQQTQPAINGQTVAWIERDTGTGNSRLLMRDINSPNITVLATLASPLAFGPPALSEDYVIWSEYSEGVPGTGPQDTLRAYNRHTGMTQTITQLSDGQGASYVIADHRVFWADFELQYRNLETGDQATITYFATNLVLAGDTLVWNQASGLGNGLDIWGMKLGDRQIAALKILPGDQEFPTIAGDWLVWEVPDGVGGATLAADLLAHAFATAVPPNQLTPSPAVPSATAIYPPPPVPTSPGISPTPGPDIRLAASRVIGEPVAGSQYVFYLSDEGNPLNTATPQPPGPPHLALYGGNVEQRDTFLIKNIAADVPMLATDGLTLVWVEGTGGGHQSIHSYYLPTHQETTVISDAGPHTFAALAVDSDVLYYQDATPGHTGLYSRSLHTGAEVLISSVGRQPVAADGILLWSEEQNSGRVTPPTSTLHLLKRDGSQANTVLAGGEGSFSGYSVSGDTVTWGFMPPNPDLRVYIYSVRSRTSRPLTAGPAIHPLVKGRTVVWTEGPIGAPGSPSGWSIKAYNMDTGLITTPVRDVFQMTQAWALTQGNVVVFTIDSGPNHRGRDLYALGFDSAAP
jgi:hypothetical protein